jgi:hypothetical protein
MRVASAIAGIGAMLIAACTARADSASAPRPSSGVAAQRSSTPLIATMAAAGQRGAGVEAAASLTAADLDDRMKKIGEAATSLRAHVMANQLSDAAKEAQNLGLWLGDVERFWAQHRKADAVTWTQAARRAATDAAGAAAGGDAAKALAATVTLQNNCSMCHAAYREGDAKSGFRIKPGTVP